jgi:hypothetical protein
MKMKSQVCPLIPEQTYFSASLTIRTTFGTKNNDSNWLLKSAEIQRHSKLKN